jgi:hypothetical protein
MRHDRLPRRLVRRSVSEGGSRQGRDGRRWPRAPFAPVLAKLQSAASRALNSPDVRERLASQGAIAVGNSSAEFQVFVKSEVERWGRVIAATGIKIK